MFTKSFHKTFNLLRMYQRGKLTKYRHRELEICKYVLRNSFFFPSRKPRSVIWDDCCPYRFTLCVVNSKVPGLTFRSEKSNPVPNFVMDRLFSLSANDSLHTLRGREVHQPIRCLRTSSEREIQAIHNTRFFPMHQICKPFRLASFVLLTKLIYLVTQFLLTKRLRNHVTSSQTPGWSECKQLLNLVRPKQMHE